MCVGVSGTFMMCVGGGSVCMCLCDERGHLSVIFNFITNCFRLHGDRWQQSQEDETDS